jgi:hypothetical protein
MSHVEIVAQLPQLNYQERQDLLERICDLQKGDLKSGRAPSPAEKQLLDEALAEFQKDGDRGTPWREVFSQIRSESPE